MSTRNSRRRTYWPVLTEMSREWFVDVPTEHPA